ncbi:MAG TPA: tRNA uracil 4-sulfurtransferase ThiI [Candidatus Binatia bacterium]|nr:tRNA uracil 4-sulfurtransferase ThiI [Candidatus Binatia bacterium]
MEVGVDTILVRTSEICLKGGNRSMFEKRLADDIAVRLAPIGAFSVRRDQGNVIVRHDGPMTEAKIAAATETLGAVFGIAWFQFAARCARDLDAVKTAAAALLAAKAPTTFKVFATRSDKSFPLDSQEIAVEVGGHLFKNVPGAAVDVHDPATRVTVLIERDGAYVSADRIEGSRGLPAGVTGKVVALLSGGIDSPVAAWKAMRRGCTPVFVHCHSYPYVGRASIDKVERLAARLATFDRGAVLWLVPIGDAQREITAKASEPERVLLYRRLMLRIAERVARRERALAIVTGDSLGQVASQTLENIAAVSAVAGMPVLRPLAGEDKDDIVAAAKRIGTYAVSIEPHDDCCTLFVPRKPATRSTAAALDAQEAAYDLEALIGAALDKAERRVCAAPARVAVVS